MGACNANGYYSFADPVRVLNIDATIAWSATVGYNLYEDGIGIWIDLNNNNIYEATEFVSSSAPATNHATSFVMPAGVTGTPLRMRVRTAYLSTPTSAQACTNGIGSGYGETEDYFVILAPSLNTNSFELTTNMSISPNPSNAIFKIEIDKKATIEVYDILGKQIVNKSLFVGTNTIDLISYEKGIYLAKITNEDNQSKTVKLIKE